MTITITQPANPLLHNPTAGGYDLIDERTDTSTPLADVLTDCTFLLSEDDDDYAPVSEDDLAQRITDKGDNTVYRLTVPGAALYVHHGAYERNVSICDSGTTWHDYLSGWDTGDATFADLLADFGLDASDALDTANEGHDGPCRVWEARNFYAGTLGNTRDGLVLGDDHEAMEFATYAEAADWIDDAESEIYSLAHGEAGRPEYTIVKA